MRRMVEMDDGWWEVRGIGEREERRKTITNQP